jgi:hypothetical protein
MREHAGVELHGPPYVFVCIDILFLNACERLNPYITNLTIWYPTARTERAHTALRNAGSFPVCCLARNPAIVFNMPKIAFFDRIKMAGRVLFSGEFADEIVQALESHAAARAAHTVPPERVHASGLMLLAAFQREGRLIDFLQQDAAGYSDEEIGAAARVVHGGCRKTLQQFMDLVSATPGAEGAPMTVPKGYDPERVRLTGNVSGAPPFKGTLKHHGWVVTKVRMPSISETLDPRVIAPAEVEVE